MQPRELNILLCMWEKSVYINRCKAFQILYHFVQFVSHASESFRCCCTIEIDCRLFLVVDIEITSNFLSGTAGDGRHRGFQRFPTLCRRFWSRVPLDAIRRLLLTYLLGYVRRTYLRRTLDKIARISV